MKYLSDEWFAEYQRLGAEMPTEPDANMTMQYVVTGGPDGDVKYYMSLEEGRITTVTRGAAPSPDITLSMKHENAVKIQRGDLTPTTAVMTGKVKSRGNMKLLMKMMPLLNSPGYQQVDLSLREVTEF